MLKRCTVLVLCLLLMFSWVAYAEPAAVAEPITIKMWHTRGSGANGEQFEASVAKFNAENELGITIEPVFQGNYETLLAKTMQSFSSSESPDLVIAENSEGLPTLASNGVLADMLPYAQRDGVDMNNYIDTLTQFCYYNGEMISVPYIRSMPVYYYNKTLFDELGLTAPETVEDLIANSKIIYEKKGISGVSIFAGVEWYIENWLYQMGSDIISKDGTYAPCMQDGTLLEVFSAWRSWVDEGWCSPTSVTNGETNMRERFANGQLASFMLSCGAMRGIIDSCDFEVGVGYFPKWSAEADLAAPLGGGCLAIIGYGKTDQQIAAAWEFVKFVMSDEQVSSVAKSTGYLPTTKSCADTDEMKELWADERFELAYKQLVGAHDLPWSAYTSEWITVLNETANKLIQDQSVTAEEALDLLGTEAALIFPLKLS
jgi:sn-glycerol 3-phosphate transport system substrate-binding protein